MNAPAPVAVSGTFADLRSVKTRSIVQMIVEIPIERAAEVIAAFGYPQPGAEIMVAVARLRAAPQIEARPAGKRSFADMLPAQQAGVLCNDARFRKFLHEERTNGWMLALSNHPDDPVEAAATTVRAACGVRSRADLNTHPQAQIAWRDLHEAYRTWLTT